LERECYYAPLGVCRMKFLVRLFFSGIALMLLLAIVASLKEKPSQLTAVDRAAAESTSVETEGRKQKTSPADYVPVDLVFTGYARGESKPLRAVVARGLTAAPGAIICSNMNATSLLFDAYAESWSEQMQERLTNGQSRLINGKPMEAPNPTAYGCELIKPGTAMQMEQGNLVPVVIAKLADGTQIRGVTLGDMVTNPVSAEDLQPGTSPLQEFHNTPSTTCGSGHPCTDEEFAESVKYLSDIWSLVPERIRVQCGFANIVDLKPCIDQQTETWKAIHPDAKNIPWTDIGQIQAQSKTSDNATSPQP